jgi:archaellum component FlaC
MGKLLRVLVFFILMFSIGTLVLGVLLFNRRELLKGRTQTLERKMKALSAYIEAGEAKVENEQTFTERDTDDCNDELLESPSRAEFWKDYDQNLEASYDTPVVLDDNTLKHYYKIETATGKIARDPATGVKITLGDETFPTMENILRDFVKKAEEQLDRLNRARAQMVVLRKELQSTIDDLNKHKHLLREAKVEITRLNGVIDGLRAEIAQLKNEIETLKGEIAGLKQQIEDLNAVIKERDETIEERDGEIKELKEELKEAMARARKVQTGGGPVLGEPGEVRRKTFNTGTPGDKGVIQSVNDTWGFVVIKLEDAALAEMLDEDENGAYIRGDAWVKRVIGGRERVIAKLRLEQVKRDGNVAIANILPRWKQRELQAGDTVFWP